MLLFVSHDSCKEHHPLNTPSDFVYDIPVLRQLEGEWSLGVIDVLFSSKLASDVFIYCDGIEESIVHNQVKPLLKVIRRPSTVVIPTFFKINIKPLYSLSFRMRTFDSDLKEIVPRLPSDGISLLLEIRKNN